MKKLLSFILALIMVVSSIAIISATTSDVNEIVWSENLVPSDYSDFDNLQIGTDPIANSNNLMIYGSSTNVNVVYDEQKGSNVLNWTGSANYHSPRWNIGGLLKNIAEEKGLTELKVKVSVDVKMNNTTNPTATNTVGNVGDFVLNGANGVSGIMLQENFGNQMGTWFTVSGEFTLTEADIQSIDMTDNAKNYGITFKGWVTGAPYGHFDNMKVQVLVPAGFEWSDNILKSEYSDFDNYTIGSDPVVTSNNVIAYNSSTNVQVVYDEEKNSNVLNWTGGNNYTAPRWNIGGILKEIATEKGLSTLKVKVSVDIKLNNSVDKTAVGSVNRVCTMILNGANGVNGIVLQDNIGNKTGTWFTASGEFTLTEADINSIDLSNNSKNYGITFKNFFTGVPYGHIDNMKVQVFLPATSKPTATVTATSVITPSPTATVTVTPVITPSPTATVTVTPVITPSPTAVVTATPVATPVPTPFAGLKNGNAESGTENWGIMYGNNGTIEQASGGANGTAHSIKFTPGERFSWGQMGSIAYDITPYVNEKGAGKYQLTFYIKAEDGKSGQFSLGFGSMYWQLAAGAKYDSNDQTKVTTVPTAFKLKDVKLTDEWQKVTAEFELTEEYLEQIALVHAARPNQAKLFFRIDGSSGAYKTAGSEFSYFVDEVTVLAGDEIPTPTPTPAPTPFAGLKNGNAENGTENWGIMYGNNGTIEQASGGANGTAHSIKFTPGERFSWGQMGSIAYDITPYVNEKGAGKYQLTFYIKAEDGKSGQFSLGFGSMYWQLAAGAKYDSNDQTKVTTVPTAFKLKDIKLTDEWQKVTAEFELTEEYLEQIALVHAVRPNQAKLFFRLDGSQFAYKTAGNEFSYFVDEVTVLAGDEIPTPTPTPAPTPFAGLKNGNAENGTENWGVMFGQNGSVENVSGGANGTAHSIKFTPGERFSWGQMGSIAYDITPYVNEKGAGKYQLSFYIKAQAGKSGTFSLGVGSMYWQNAANAKYDPNDQTKTTNVPTAFKLKDINVTDKWQQVTVEFELTKEYIEQIKLVHAVRPNQAKIFFRLDGSNGAYKKAGSEFSYFVDEVVVLAGKDIPTPTPFAGLKNGNAESGTKNWSVMYGQNGSIKQVKDGANGTKHSIKFTPGNRFEWGQTGSIAYDITPYINAKGAGVYKLSFYIKAEEGKGGKFSLGVGSMYWQIKEGAKYDPKNQSLKTTLPTAYKIKDIEITDEWQLVEVEFKITKDYLKQIALVHTARPNQAQIFFRLDGSQLAFKQAGSEFSYFVDEVVLKIDGKDKATNTGDMMPVMLIGTTIIATIALITFKKRKED